jgi:hypothetical protein
MIDPRSATILLLIVMLLTHLMEEVLTDFRRRLPIGEMPIKLFIGINVALYLFCITTFALSLRQHPWAIPMAWLFAIGMLLNGVGHLGYMLLRRAYFPGGFSALPLSVASVLLIAVLSQ